MMRMYRDGQEPIPGYRLVSFIGEGGFGEVWKCTGPGNTQLALKVLPLSGQGFKEFRAIRLVKNLRHPNLIPLFGFWLKDDYGHIIEDGGGDDSVLLRGKATQLLIAMGLADMSLAKRLDDCKLAGMSGIPVEELLDYMEEAAKAIDFLNQPTHNMGSGPVAIQHCDIKPGNLLLVGGSVQVCDYGLARALVTDMRATSAAYTPAYQAPELIKAGPSKWTDQYSLAISYFELRKGVLPFNAQNAAAAILAHSMGDLHLTLLPDAEMEVVSRATQLQPEKRYPRTIDFVHALRKAVFPAKAVAGTGSSQAIPLFALLTAGREIVPGYKLVEKIGQGGYGEVWKAKKPGGIDCAIKIVKLEGAQSRQEFRTLEMLKGLDHDFLMELEAYWLLDSGGQVIDDDRQAAGAKPAMLIIATKLASMNLMQWLEEYNRRGYAGIPVPELLAYMRQTAEALDYLNTEMRIQHRDIKPENILLSKHRKGYRAKVSDFGLAKAVEGTSAAIRSESRGMTLAYAAPELHRNYEVTKWTDQYALAITYYKLRTGHLPFDANATPVQIILAHANGELDFRHGTAAEQAIMRRGTAVKPETRFETCEALVAELEKSHDVTNRTGQDVAPLIDAGTTFGTVAHAAVPSSAHAATQSRGDHIEFVGNSGSMPTIDLPRDPRRSGNKTDEHLISPVIAPPVADARRTPVGSSLSETAMPDVVAKLSGNLPVAVAERPAKAVKKKWNEDEAPAAAKSGMGKLLAAVAGLGLVAVAGGVGYVGFVKPREKGTEVAGVTTGDTKREVTTKEDDTATQFAAKIKADDFAGAVPLLAKLPDRAGAEATLLAAWKAFTRNTAVDWSKREKALAVADQFSPPNQKAAVDHRRFEQAKQQVADLRARNVFDKAKDVWASALAVAGDRQGEWKSVNDEIAADIARTTIVTAASATASERLTAVERKLAGRETVPAAEAAANRNELNVVGSMMLTTSESLRWEGLKLLLDARDEATRGTAGRRIGPFLARPGAEPAGELTDALVALAATDRSLVSSARDVVATRLVYQPKLVAVLEKFVQADIDATPPRLDDVLQLTQPADAEASAWVRAARLEALARPGKGGPEVKTLADNPAAFDRLGGYGQYVLAMAQATADNLPQAAKLLEQAYGAKGRDPRLDNPSRAAQAGKVLMRQAEAYRLRTRHPLSPRVAEPRRAAVSRAADLMVRLPGLDDDGKLKARQLQLASQWPKPTLPPADLEFLLDRLEKANALGADAPVAALLRAKLKADAGKPADALTDYESALKLVKATETTANTVVVPAAELNALVLTPAIEAATTAFGKSADEAARNRIAKLYVTRGKMFRTLSDDGSSVQRTETLALAREAFAAALDAKPTGEAFTDAIINQMDLENLKLPSLPRDEKVKLYNDNLKKVRELFDAKKVESRWDSESLYGSLLIGVAAYTPAENKTLRVKLLTESVDHSLKAEDHAESAKLPNDERWILYYNLFQGFARLETATPGGKYEGAGKYNGKSYRALAAEYSKREEQETPGDDANWFKRGVRLETAAWFDRSRADYRQRDDAMKRFARADEAYEKAGDLGVTERARAALRAAAAGTGNVKEWDPQLARVVKLLEAAEAKLDAANLEATEKARRTADLLALRGQYEALAAPNNDAAEPYGEAYKLFARSHAEAKQAGVTDLYVVFDPWFAALTDEADRLLDIKDYDTLKDYWKKQRQQFSDALAEAKKAQQAKLQAALDEAKKEPADKQAAAADKARQENPVLVESYYDPALAAKLAEADAGGPAAAVYDSFADALGPKFWEGRDAAVKVGDLMKVNSYVAWAGVAARDKKFDGGPTAAQSAGVAKFLGAMAAHEKFSRDPAVQGQLLKAAGLLHLQAADRGQSAARADGLAALKAAATYANPLAANQWRVAKVLGDDLTEQAKEVAKNPPKVTPPALPPDTKAMLADARTLLTAAKKRAPSSEQDAIEVLIRKARP